MVPASSISKMFDIIRDENVVSSYSAKELKDFLCALRHGDLARLRDNEGHSLLSYFPCVTNLFVNQIDMVQIVRLEDTLIEELRKRGEIPPAKKFS